MFEFQFSNSKKTDIRKILRNQYSGSGDFIPLMWGEHCIECSAPHCYFTCPRYAGRQDGHCVRFENGIEPVLYENRLCAKIKFKPWSKLEAKSEKYMVDESGYKKIYRSISCFGRLCCRMSKLMPGVVLKSKWTGAWEYYRQFKIRGCNSIPINSDVMLDYTIINNQNKIISFFVDLKGANGDLLMREKVNLPLGRCKSSLPLPRYKESKVINLHPVDADASVELIIEELEIKQISTLKNKSKQVKCVIWDLDNTLWDGILIEDEKVTFKQDLVELIKFLDSKGIVNSVASKNDESQAIQILCQAGIDDLFVFKKINWLPKSQNIQKTIKSMNINANTVVFVDDNPFERDEVKSVIQDITCIDPSEIIEYSKSERFNVIESGESAKRRYTYMMLEQLKQEEENWTGSIDSFLISCQIKLEMSKPTPQNIQRCYELLQRTNQLNSSGRRLSLDEVIQITNSNEYNCFVLKSSDKFGSYGIVGFLIVHIEDKPRITDFVISCRVANKKIEPTLINYLANQYGGMVLFDFKKTKLNGPMKNIIDELGMKLLFDSKKIETYIHRFNESYPNIVTVITNCK